MEIEEKAAKIGLRVRFIKQPGKDVRGSEEALGSKHFFLWQIFHMHTFEDEKTREDKYGEKRTEKDK